MAQILTLAKDHSFAGKMSSNQAFYVQGWIASAISDCLGMLKMREMGFATGAKIWSSPLGCKASAISLWRTTTRTGKRAMETPRTIHLYWAGVEICAIGVVANNRKDFDWAMATYDNRVNEYLPKNGTLPLEMARGGRALHYHLQTLAPLVFLAEFRGSKPS